MLLKEDITRKIQADFGSNANAACKMLIAALEKTGHLNSDRVIRSMIFLSKGDLKELNRCIAAGTIDTRDILLWAEYKKQADDSNYKRMRDFEKTFEECSDKVKE